MARLFILDTFTDRLLGGNPAPVVLLEAFPSDARLKALAGELAHPVSAFVVDHGPTAALRVFTPAAELGLVGHACMAAAWALVEMVDPARRELVLESPVGGRLPVERGQGRLWLGFPAMPGAPVDSPPALQQAIGAGMIQETLVAPFGYVAVLESAAAVAGLAPDLAAVMQLDRGAAIVTAPGDGCDFVSRVFAPKADLPEDPVCGTAHRIMAPYWAARLGRDRLRALQLSPRGGDLACRVDGETVWIGGTAVRFSEGVCEI
jgi:PhzF family phenazine biosynthesis protein